MTLVAAPRASSVAPVPRPPQPIRPILISVTLPAAPEPACTSGTPAAAAAPASPSEVCLRKFRREDSPSEAWFGAYIVVLAPEENANCGGFDAVAANTVQDNSAIGPVIARCDRGPDRAGP